MYLAKRHLLLPNVNSIVSNADKAYEDLLIGHPVLADLELDSRLTLEQIRAHRNRLPKHSQHILNSINGWKNPNLYY